jgi:hypothetical protein
LKTPTLLASTRTEKEHRRNISGEHVAQKLIGLEVALCPRQVLPSKTSEKSRYATRTSFLALWKSFSVSFDSITTNESFSPWVAKSELAKPGRMVAQAECFEANEIPSTLLDLDTENKAQGALKHFFNGLEPK